MSTYRDAEELGPRLRVLEELRTCDRMLAGLLATLATADADEPRVSAFDEDTVDHYAAQRASDRATAARELVLALAVLRRALALFDEQSHAARADWPAPSAALRRFGRTAGGTGIADEAQAEVRAWFDALRRSDPQLAPVVRELTDWHAPEPEPAALVPVADDDPDSTALVRRHPAVTPLAVVAASGAALAALLALARGC